MVTEFQDSTLITLKVMSFQVHVIRKATRLLFADLIHCGLKAAAHVA